LLISSNGTTWSPAKNSPDNELSYIAFGNGIFVGTGYSLQDFCYTSIDGNDWAPVDVAGRRAYQVVFGNDKFLAQVDDGFIYYSSDGMNWTPTTQPAGFILAFANGKFLALQYNVPSSESVDGISWQPTAPVPSMVYLGTV